MQPYFFPYLGYFQLLRAADIFVFLDDVHFIKRGWINRNRILVDNSEFLFTISCEKVSQNRLIKDIGVVNDKNIGKFLKTVEMAYVDAPNYSAVMSLVDSVFRPFPRTISELAMRSVRSTWDFLGLKTEFRVSSSYGERSLSGAERLIEICVREGCSHYINPVGGAELYNKGYFCDKGIKLSFLKPQEIIYSQFDHEFVPWLSMIDVLMFNHTDAVRRFLDHYELV